MLTWKPNPLELVKVASILRDVLVQVWIRFDAHEGVSVIAVDPTKTATIVYHNQEGLEYAGDKPLVFCFFTSNFYKALKRVNKKSDLQITNTNLDHVIKIKYDDYTFRLTSMPDVTPSYQFPALKADIQFRRETKDLYDTFYCISGISTRMSVHILNETITWKTTRDEGGMELSIAEMVPGLSANFHGSFFVKYAQKVLKTNMNKEVVVTVDKDKKAISFQLGDNFTLLMALE